MSTVSAAAMPLEGLRAVITGGGSGIGLAIARRLRSLGAALVLLGRDRARLERALADVGGGPDDATVACDVGDAAAVTRAFASLAERPAQLLVNGAGAAKSAKFSELSDALWEDALRVNLTGVFHCIRAALPALREARFGRIVNVASTAGLTGYPYVAAYCAAKHGVVGLTRSLALELARTRITVNAVCPGYTETALLDGAIDGIVAATGRSRDEARDALASRNPQRRLVSSDEVAATVAWLCLPESQAITGQAISVSGGEVMAG